MIICVRWIVKRWCWISLVIVLGQVIIVTFAGKMFGVEPLGLEDWLLILLLTSPVLIVADIFRTVKNLIGKEI